MALSFLMIASMLPKKIQAEESEDRIDFKYMYYWDKNDVWNHTPAFDWIKKISHAWSFQWSQELDLVSGASRRLGLDKIGKLGDHGVDANSGASKRAANGKPFEDIWSDSAFDVIAGASQKEMRHSENPSFTYSNNGQVYTAGFYFSDESDYRSYSPTLSIAHDFNERNTTVSASLAWFFDDFHPQGAFADQGGHKQIRSLTLSASQLLTPLTLVAITANGIYSNGYLGHPYNPIILDSGKVIEENTPREKKTLAIAGQVIQGYRWGDHLGSIHLEARHYMDSWAMVADDAELQWYQYFGEERYFRMRVRGYAQSATGFAKDPYVGDELYRSADIRYTKFSSLTVGVKFATTLAESWHDNAWLPDRFDMSYDQGIRNTKGDEGNGKNYFHYQLFSAREYYQEGTFMLGLGFDL